MSFLHTGRESGGIREGDRDRQTETERDRQTDRERQTHTDPELSLIHI